ncbi:hypothetical protein AURDEDRAFT_125841 [Auricularia subglabra TFB-10046 SS5]|nr:hypothetical protein AURDEDRAFT_125841 [Auricularia subglabra TFB-10046 SS5]
MSSQPTTPTSATIPPFVSPILEAFASSIQPPIAFLMIGTIFSSMLLPLLIAVVYFSNDSTRRQPIYKLVVFVIMLALGLGVWNGVIEVTAILSPLVHQSENEYFAFEVAYSITPWLVDLVLFLRLMTVFNPKQTKRSTLLAVFAFPVAIKALRLAMIITFAIQWHRHINHIGSALLAAGQTWATSFCVKVEWVSQIFDNGYASALFMYRLRGSIRLSASPGAGRDTVGQRIATLFWIAATNFVFPDLTVSDSMFLRVNTYLSILGVVFATVWSSSLSAAGSARSTLIQTSGMDTGGRISFKHATAHEVPQDATYSLRQTMNDTEDDSRTAKHHSEGGTAIQMAVLLDGSASEGSRTM